jgi:phage terminase Nu1 subunit (DNA packaging protein)
MTDMRRLTQQEAAWLLGVTPRALRDMDAPRAEDGSYCARTLVEWRYRDRGFTSQRERLAARQAERLEIEVAVKRGELLYASEVTRVWADHIVNARDKLRAIPRKLAPQLAATRSPDLAVAILTKEIDDALSELGNEHQST